MILYYQKLENMSKREMNMAKNLSKSIVDEIETDEELESDDVTKKDHILLLIIGWTPFIIATIWYNFYYL